MKSGSFYSSNPVFILIQLIHLRTRKSSEFLLFYSFFSVEEDSAQVPFPELCGESVEYLEKTSDALLALSNFRLFIRFKDSFVNVCLSFECSEQVETVFHQDIQTPRRKLKI